MHLQKEKTKHPDYMRALIDQDSKTFKTVKLNHVTAEVYDPKADRILKLKKQKEDLD